MTFYETIKIDDPVKTLEIVIPDPVSGTGQARSPLITGSATGIQNTIKILDSDFLRVHQDYVTILGDCRSSI